MASGKSTSKSNNTTKYNKKQIDKNRKNAQKTSAKSASKTSKKSTEKNLAEFEPRRRGLSLTVAIILGLFFALILELCNFDVLGKVGGWVKYAEFGLFGAMAYVFPIGLLMLFIVSSFESSRFRYIFSGVVLFLFLCTFAHLVSSLSLNNRDVLSYFDTCGNGLNGGGIIGGAIALLLYMLLSETGAIIISVLVMLVCIFFIAEDLILDIISGILYTDDDYDDDEDEEQDSRPRRNNKSRHEDEDEYYENRKSGRRREQDPYPEQREERNARKQAARRRRDDEDYYDEREHYRRRGNYYNEYGERIEDTSDGTVIRIVRTKNRRGRVKSTELIRTTRKAAPTRDGADLVRSGRKVRGISNNTALLPVPENEDEVRQIRRGNGSRKKSSADKQMPLPTFIDDQPSKSEKLADVTGPIKALRQMELSDVMDLNDKSSYLGPDDTLSEPRARKKSAPAEFNDLEFNNKEARVTSVRQAAVNRRIRDAKLVKESKQEIAARRAAEVKTSASDMTSSGSVASPDLNPAGRKTRDEGVQKVKNASSNELAYFAPPLELLSVPKRGNRTSDEELAKIAMKLKDTLEYFGVRVEVVNIQAGPSVTRFELQPELGTRVNKITSLADDLKLNLGVTEIRIEAPIPGRQAVGIEIPNKIRQTVYMRELLESPDLINHKSKIAFAAGKDISGNVVVADIAKMPHLLVAGTTGSGKSVFLNTILMTILYRAKPSEVGLIIVDPKKVEFGIYQGIPHLMKDVVTDPGQAVSTLRWAVNEMTNRYQRMQMSAVRDFKSYNEKVEKGTVSKSEENPRKMNQIVIIIDELADLMMVAKKEAESLICRLAQLARAAGIHLVIATQRPSVDVVTGLIKANIPGRVALLVSSQIDSRTIIDMPGAEKLLGNGDMLFYPTGYVKPLRVQGAFVSDDEIQETVDFLIDNNHHNYFEAESKEIEKFQNSQGDEGSSSEDSGSEGSSKYDDCFYEAGRMCIEMGKASSSMLQRRFNLGFNRAARIIDQLEEFGAVGPQNGAKPRQILVDEMTFEQMYQDKVKGN